MPASDAMPIDTPSVVSDVRSLAWPRFRSARPSVSRNVIARPAALLADRRAPSSIVIVRCAYCCGEAASCVTMMIVLPSRSFSSLSSAMISRVVRLSRLPVGSSASSRCGLFDSARAIATRCCSPPESSRGRCCCRPPRPIDSSSCAACAVALGARHAGEHHRQRHVLRRAHRRDQVERLEDDADVLPAVQAQLDARHLREVLVEDAQRPVGRAIEPGDQVEQRGLAGSGGAEQADELPLSDGERHAVEGADGRGPHPVVLLEIAGFEHGGHGTLQYKAMAALIEAIEIKRKMFFEYEGAPYHTIDVEVSRPTARGGQTLVRIKMRNLITRAVFDKTFKAGDKFARAGSRADRRDVPVRRQRRLSLHGPGDASTR